MANTLTFANQTIADANIFGGINFSVDLNAGEEFSIGNTASASVSFVTDIQLPRYSKDSVNGTFVWEKDGVIRGRYYITEVTKESDKYSITAYDAMTLLDKPISVLNISYPVTVSALATQIATYMGCTVSGTINNGSLSVSELDELTTIRTVLGYIAEASGCSVKVDGSDHLCFMYYADSGTTITASEYISLNVADYTCAAIDNVTIFNSEGEIQATAGSGSNSLFIGQNPFLEEATNTNAQTILSKVSGFTYAPLKCELFNDDDIEVGTIVTFGSTPTLVMHVDSSESGATASSVGSDIRANYNKSALEVVGEARAIAVDAQTMADMATGLLSGMQTAAAQAGTTLNGIYADAETSKSVLAGMQTAAQQAGTTLNGIYQTAADARHSAENASEYAARALGNLGSVQSVAETLAWITAHGTMTLTTDTALDPSHVYFVVDANGDYTVGGTHYSVVSEPVLADIGTYYELSINESLNNYVATHLVVDTEGLWIIPDAGGNKVLIATGSGSTYTTAGTYIVGSGGVVLASFTADGIQVGQTGETHLGMDYHSMQLVDKEDNAYFYVSDLRDKNDNYQATITETFIGDGTHTSFIVQLPVSAEVSATDSSHSSNVVTRSDTRYTFTTAPDNGATITIIYKTTSKWAKAYTFGTRATGVVGAMSVAEGSDTIASGGRSHAEGWTTTASGFNSHAEGFYTRASGDYSHAEGGATTADGAESHAEGIYTTASGSFSHAEGHTTIASGDRSHSQNNGTIAQRKSQTALGEYNIADTGGTNGTTRGDYAVIVGNGTSDSARSNALGITWDGDAHMALDTTATSGTDKEIYDALVSLGWDSDVIV